MLATVTISLAFGENGLVKKTEEARDMEVNSAFNEAESMNQMLSEIDNITEKKSYEEEIEVFKQGERNLIDALSLVQIANSSVSEIHDMLNRVNQLTANIVYGTTNTTEIILNYSQEINALLDEIENIAKNTTFNEINIIDGSLMGTNAYKVEIVTRELTLEIEGMTRQDLGLEQIGDLTIKEEATNLFQKIQQAIKKVSYNEYSLGQKEELYDHLADYYKSSKEILSQNLSEDKAKDKLAKNGIENIISILERIKNLEINSQNIANDYKEFILSEINELLNGIDIIAEDLECKGQKLLNGSYKNIPNLNSQGISQDGEKFYVDISTQENISKSITECENAINKIEDILDI